MGGRKYRVVALAGDLECRVAGIVDEIGVVAGAADHEVGADPPLSRLLPVLP